jgi:hypothetical protein
MTRVHAFTGDDALADLDATGLVAALAAGEVSVPEVVDAAIARTQQVDPALGAVAYAAYDRAPRRGEASTRRLVRRDPDLRQGQRRRGRHAHPARQRRVHRRTPAGRR